MRTFKKEDIIFQEGTKSHELFIIMKGEVEFTKKRLANKLGNKGFAGRGAQWPYSPNLKDQNIGNLFIGE